MANESDMTLKGYPTIAVVGGFFIFAYTIFYSATKTGYGGWRNHASWFFFNLWLWLFGLFLVFGPDSLASQTVVVNGMANTFGTTGPRAAILGLQLMVQASIGAFAIFSANAYASLVFALFGIFNELGLIGSLWLFNYNQPIWTLDTTQCNAYFGYYSPDTVGRCNDNGYLEFLRVIGTLEIIVNGYLIVVSLLAYATAVPAHAVYGGPNAGVPAGGAAYGAPAGTTGYAANPTYGTSTAGPGFVAQTGAPATQHIVQTTTTTPYTTTTGVPATTTTHL